MVTEEINSIYLCIACIVALICIFNSLYADLLEIKKNTRLIRRCEELHDYIGSVLDKDLESYLKLPTFEEMLYSDKPLEDEYWINK